MNEQETLALVASLPNYSWNDAAQLECSGYYLIYDEAGNLLYVGESTNVGSRLCHHGAKRNSGNLYWHLVDELTDGEGLERAHHCACGKLIACHAGDRLQEVRVRISNRFERFTVRVAEFDPEDKERFAREQDCQEHLKPRYPRKRQEATR